MARAGRVGKYHGKKGDSWYVVAYKKDRATGKRYQEWYRGYPTKTKADEKLDEIAGQRAAGVHIRRDKVTVGEWLDQWLEARRTGTIAPKLRESTVASYQGNITKHLKPALGAVKLQDLTRNDVRDFHAKLAETALSHRSRGYCHIILRAACKAAVAEDLLVRNPTDGVSVPAGSEPAEETMHVLTVDQAKAYVAAARGERLGAALILAVRTGLRRGELLGLTWSDGDLERGVLNIRQTRILIRNQQVASDPKTKRSRRSIRVGAATVELLREWRDRQLSESNVFQIGAPRLVFTTEFGEPLHPKVLTDAHRRVEKAAGIPHVRFHDLRHTAATMMLADGVSAKVVADRLGHSNIRTTLDIYAHTLEEQDLAAAEAVEARY